MGVKVSVNVLYQIFAAFTGTTGWAKKRGHSLSEKKLIGEYLAKLQARMWLSRALVRLANTLLKDRDHVLACNFAKYWPI